MPEGDSLHRAAARLRVLVGERIAAESPHPRGAATRVAQTIDGRVLQSVEAVGKNLLLRFDGNVVVRSHLRMKGRWRVRRAAGALVGKPWLVLRGGGWEATQWNGPVLALQRDARLRVGTDLLADETVASALVDRLRRADAARSLGEVLQDQRLVSGIGNMWMSELLWATRLSPWLPLGETTDAELKEALRSGRASMRAAVVGSRPVRSVYRKSGRPCPRCGTPIRARGQGDANRTAYWCPGCQRGPIVS